MKFIHYISCLAILISMSGLSGATGIATVHGVAYEWSTFEPLDNAIVEVNSTPSQSIVAKYGVYSFELPSGSYMITAKYYQDGTLSHYAEEEITVSDDGNYVVDLLLLPSYSDSSEIESTMVNANGIEGNSETMSEAKSGNLLAGASIVGILVLALLLYQVRFKTRTFFPKSKPGKKKHIANEELQTKAVDENDDKSILPEATTVSFDIDIPVTESEPDVNSLETVQEDVSDTSPESVPKDLQEILDILESQGGRMTQKDMRSRLKYSEGKVSLMLLDLEKRGKIQKYKKGRGNILFLVDDE
ncbi:hypothetical protein V7O62_07175 [Methanolobus sp. ZRKC2]|uniref:helix-turn-helix transcriptional regulator n=1 Tax=Methanolobus sp. ZRKC2 TaxID=3125783 RepID=UPI00324F0255